MYGLWGLKFSTDYKKDVEGLSENNELLRWKLLFIEEIELLRDEPMENVYYSFSIIIKRKLIDSHKLNIWNNNYFKKSILIF